MGALSSSTTASPEQYRTLVETLPAQAWVALPDGTLDFVNRRALEYLDRSAEEAHAASWFEFMHPEDRDRAKAKWRQALDDGTSFEVECRLQRGSDGAYRWFLCRAVPGAAPDGQASRWFGINTDITTRKQENVERERLATIVENSPDFVGSFSLDGNAVFLNEAGRGMVGVHSLEKVRTKRLQDFHPEEERSHLDDEVLPTVHDTGRWHGELKLVRSEDAAPLPIDADFFLTRDPATRDAEYIVAVYRDVTPYKEAQEEAERANRAKSEFLANMSHELRTPLNAVIGYSEMIREDLTDDTFNQDGEEKREQLIDDLKQIHTAGKQLLSMVNDVLDISKIEAGEMELNVSRFDVAEMIEDVASTVRPLVKQNDNELVVDGPKEAGTMQADLTKLRQGLFNLLGNAAKFTENGRITLRTRREEFDEQPGFVFEVEDTGIGMSEVDQQKIFKAFSQADTSLTREHEGAGLGLVITRNYMKMMGGDVTVQSEEGVGSTFTIHLPAESAGGGRIQEITSSAQAAPSTRPRDTDGQSSEELQGEEDDLVLIIDDDARARDLIARHLRKEGFQTATASGGEEGIAKARELEPTVITLDVMMPKMDGWAVLSRLQNDEELRTIPVVMVTIVDEEEMGYVLGAEEYLTKPLNAERLTSVIQRYRSDGDADCTVLLVEDDPVTRELIQRTLTVEGHYEVCEAENGRQALERLDETKPAVILLDLMMPEMDGFTFLKKMRERPGYASLPVIVMTAKELTSDDRRQLNEDVEEVLQKGHYQRDELLATVTSRVRDVVPND